MSYIGATLAVGVAGSMLAASVQDCKNVAGGFLVKDTSAKCGPRTEMRNKLTSLAENISNSIQTAVNNTTSNIATSQVQTVNISGNCCQGINISQSTNLDIKVMSEISNTLRDEIITNIKEAVKQDLNQVTTQINSMLNSGGGGQTIIDLEQHISTIIQSNTTKTAVTDAISNIASSQTQSINITCSQSMDIPDTYRGSNGACVIDQKLVALLQAEVIIKTVFDILRNDSIIKEVQTVISQKATQQNKGIEDIFESMGKIVMYIVIAIVAIAVLAIPILIFSGKFGGKGSTTVSKMSEKAIAQFLRSRK